MNKIFQRDSQGFLNLNNLTKSEHFVNGRKEKIWLKDESDNEYLFKYGASNYEIWAEMIAEDIGKQCGIEMAHYEPARYKHNIGVVTPNFVENNMLLISAERLRKNQIKIMTEGNKPIDLLKGINLDVIMFTLIFNSNLSADTYNDILYELQKRWCFWQLIMESDKNLTNISFISNGCNYKLSPDYDNSTMARLNENITNFLNIIKSDMDIYKLIDDVEQSLALDIKNDNKFYSSFTKFCEMYPENAQTIMQQFKNIDLDIVFKTREANLSNNTTGTKVEIPWEVKYWLTKVINIRYHDMQAILKSVLAKNSNKNKI